ncbi:hypothetical protein FSP39_002287 [Pinctada imbricata]|uniref:Integrase catalytic domain-containing protein n=1 Tax=Pinctada imbricata TaxID=66713 RepID=A0AA88YMM4_PINIB|nr:hypothetical protein FSP39_002287 [Pinctada imbricata]
MVERLNRTIKDMLSKYISANQIDWDRYIDYFVLAYNTTPHESTDISPYRMLHGREARIPSDLLTERDQNNSNSYHYEAEYVRDLQEKLSEIHDIARETLKKSSERQKRNYDRIVRELNYDIGDLVRRSQPKIAKGTKQKLSRIWTGPWIIVKRLSEVLYQIKHSKNSKPVIIHADNLKPYKGTRTTDQELTEHCEKEAESQKQRLPDQSAEPKPVPVPRRPRAVHQKTQVTRARQTRPVTITTRAGRTVKRPQRYLD